MRLSETLVLGGHHLIVYRVYRTGLRQVFSHSR